MSNEEYQSKAESNRKTAGDIIQNALNEYRVDALLTFDNRLSALYAPAGYPALNVPAGYRSTGEPSGITLVGGFLDDAKLITIAFAYEQASHFRRDPVVSET